MVATQWTIEELHAELGRFEEQLRAAGLKDSSVLTYTDRTARFLRWLVGEYQPGRAGGQRR